MKRIGEFLQEHRRNLLGVGSNALVPLQAHNMSEDEANKMSREIESVVLSTEFADELDSAVPPPQPGESEDAFVSRAKEAISIILMAKFGE